MENKEILQRLLQLAEQQQQSINELREIVKAQQAIIDSLTNRPQNVNINFGSCMQIGNGNTYNENSDSNENNDNHADNKNPK